MTDLAEIREEGVILQVASEWGAWSPCTQCVNNRGIKTSRGYCRLKRSINPVSIMLNYITLLLLLQFIIIVISGDDREKRVDRYLFLSWISDTALQVNISGILVPLFLHGIAQSLQIRDIK